MDRSGLEQTPVVAEMKGDRPDSGRIVKRRETGRIKGGGVKGEEAYSIIGFWIDGEIVCLRCLTEEEKEQTTPEEDVIYRKDAEDTDSFCDRCGRPLIRDS